jgi:hypothetical protein
LGIILNLSIAANKPLKGGLMATAAILFAIAAIGGATMAAMRLQGRELPPLWLALVHGGVAAAGLITLIVTVAQMTVVPTTAVVSLIGFILAALGGFALFLLFHMKKKALPINIMLAHATLAVISFVILLIGVFQH